jgi:hypothetical protein
VSAEERLNKKNRAGINAKKLDFTGIHPFHLV